MPITVEIFSHKSAILCFFFQLITTELFNVVMELICADIILFSLKWQPLSLDNWFLLIFYLTITCLYKYCDICMKISFLEANKMHFKTHSFVYK